MSRYCVIGAGAAGISALEQLRKAGYDVDCFEQTDRVGGHWHTDYDALHLITSRDMTTFEDFPMPAVGPVTSAVFDMGDSEAEPARSPTAGPA